MQVKVKTLDALMHVSLCGKEVKDMERPFIFDVWSAMKTFKSCALYTYSN
jgi:hypothetical protein